MDTEKILESIISTTDLDTLEKYAIAVKSARRIINVLHLTRFEVGDKVSWYQFTATEGAPFDCGTLKGRIVRKMAQTVQVKGENEQYYQLSPTVLTKISDVNSGR